MSERLRTGTHTVARGDRVVLRRTDIRSETSGEAEVDHFSIGVEKKFRNPYGSNPPFDPQTVLPSEPQDLSYKKIFDPM